MVHVRRYARVYMPVKHDDPVQGNQSCPINTWDYDIPVLMLLFGEFRAIRLVAHPIMLEKDPSKLPCQHLLQLSPIWFSSIPSQLASRRQSLHLGLLLTGLSHFDVAQG